jgi:hypothetical protein
MKKLIGYTSCLALVALLTGCAGMVNSMGPAGGSFGVIYSDVSGALLATGNTGSSKVGKASSTGIVCVALGDSSIKAACDNGGITKIHHADYHVLNVLGVYNVTTVTVYGE